MGYRCITFESRVDALMMPDSTVCLSQSKVSDQDTALFQRCMVHICV
jgi:hypothetical protein